MGPYAALIGAGINLVQGVVAGRRAKKNAKKQKKAAAQQAALLQGINSPQHFQDLMNQYRGQFQQAYQPALRQVGDVLGLNEQNAMEGMNADLSRRGLSGSGMAFAGQNAIRSARMTGLGDAQRQYQMDVENATRNQANQAIAGQMQGQAMAPSYQYTPPGPSGLETMLNAGSSAIGSLGYGNALQGNSPQSFGQAIGLKGGPLPPGVQGPTQPYYVGNNPGQG